MQDIWASGVWSQLFAARLLNTCLYFCAYYLAWDSEYWELLLALCYTQVPFPGLVTLAPLLSSTPYTPLFPKLFATCETLADWGLGAVLISFLGKPTSLSSRGPNSHSPLPIIRAGKMAEVASTASNLRKTALLNKNTKLKVLICIYNSARRQNYWICICSYPGRIWNLSQCCFDFFGESREIPDQSGKRGWLLILSPCPG